MASSLLINEHPLQVLPSLAVKIGLNEAIILQQVHYWLNPKLNKNIFEGHYWVYNTYEQWQKQFPFWGEKTIRRAIGNLEKSELLKSFVTRDFKKTKYYTINYGLLQQFQEPQREDKKSKNLPACKANKEPWPSGQNDQMDASKRADRSGQNDPIGRVNMTTFYNTETTTETTPPLLSSPPEELQEDEEEDFKHMIKIWNDIVQSKLNPGKDVCLTSLRVQKLKRIKREVFESNLDSWKAYCNQIAENGFLMGESSSGFKVTFDWALSRDNACKILEGAIYDKEENVSQKPLEEKEPFSYLPWDAYFKELEDRLKGDPYIEIWMNISKILAPKIGQLTFKRCFWNIIPLEFSDGTLILQAESSALRDYLTKNHERDIGGAVLAAYPHVTKLILKIKSEKDEKF